MSEAGLAQARRRMADRGIDARSIGAFEHYYRQLEDGARGTIPESSIEPLADLPQLTGEGFTEQQRREALARTVVIKLNGARHEHGPGGPEVDVAGARRADLPRRYRPSAARPTQPVCRAACPCCS